MNENANKELINKLSKLSPMLLSLAYHYAISYAQYGVDVTEKWLTVTQNTSALEVAYRKGYYDALNPEKIVPLKRVKEVRDKIENLTPWGMGTVEMREVLEILDEVIEEVRNNK